MSDPSDERDPGEGGDGPDGRAAGDEEVAAAAAEQFRSDEYLAPVVAEHGVLRLDPAEDLFERLVISILRQQVSMASAAATRERLFDAVEVTPEGILAAEESTLRDAGLSRQKTRYVRAVAETFREEGYDRDHFADASDEAIVDALTAITGVGDWTARMQLLFTFARPDVFPVGDLGVRKGVQRLVDEDLSRAEMVELAERWAPYRSYASLYLWRVDEDIADSVDEVAEG